MKIICYETCLEITPESLQDRIYLECVLDLKDENATAIARRITLTPGGSLSYVLIEKTSEEAQQ